MLKNEQEIALKQRDELSDALFFGGAEEWFLSRAIRCGSMTRRYFVNLLGIKSCELKDLFWKIDHFEINLFLKNKYLRTVVLKKFKPKEMELYKSFGMFAVGGELVLICEAEDRLAGLQEIFSAAKENLFRIKTKEMFQILQKDKGNFIKEVAGGAVREKDPKQDISVLTEFPYFEWGNEHVKNLFMFQAMIKGRIPFGGIRLEDMVNINHGDNECAYMAEQPDREAHFSFLSLPKQEREELKSDKKKEDIKGSGRFKQAASILYDDDIVKGGSERLKEFLKEVSSEDPKCNVLINCNCAPLIIGDDIRSVVENINKNTGASFLYCDSVKQSASEIYFKYAKELFEGLPEQKVSVRSINLCGFPGVLGLKELKNELSALGVKINSEMLPLITKKDSKVYKQAALQVFFPNKEYEKFYNQVLVKTGVKKVQPEAPYGFFRSRNWLKAIAKGLGIDLNKEAYWQKIRIDRHAEWKKRTIKAADHKLGLVFAEQDIPFVLETQKSILSIPLLSFLEEMGFGLEIVLYCNEDKFGEYEKELRKLFENQEQSEFICCENNIDIQEWLDTTGCSCIYSDLAFDERLLFAGKEQFSIFDLEMGFDGAIRSIELLLKKCQNSFLKKYNAYFQGKPTPVSIEE